MLVVYYFVIRRVTCYIEVYGNNDDNYNITVVLYNDRDVSEFRTEVGENILCLFDNAFITYIQKFNKYIQTEINSLETINTIGMRV